MLTISGNQVTSIKMGSLLERTESERIFEQYLESREIKWERLTDVSYKHPDYRVLHNDQACFFEVKEFDHPPVKPVGCLNPCPPIREKITQARKQFRNYRTNCCSLVLWSKSIYRTLFVDTVAATAFGQSMFIDRRAGELGSEPSCYRHMGSAELRKDQNTTISAIVILAPYQLDHLWLEMWRVLERKQREGVQITPWLQFEVLGQLPMPAPRYSFAGTIRGMVIENPFARVPFPPGLMTGPFDQRWRMEDGWLRLASLGSELLKLREEGVPFIYL